MAKSYEMHCPVARTLDVIGERWAILVLRDLLLFKSRRFVDFVEALPGIPPNTLSARLKQLEAAGVVERRLYEQHPPRAEYILTAKGRELGPIVAAMRKWGNRHGSEDNEARAG